MNTITYNYGFTPEAMQQMKQHDALMTDEGFEGALYREQVNNFLDSMKNHMRGKIMERALPKMPVFMAA